MSRRLGHLPALDGVRAFAILGVMGLHAIDRFFPGGFYGVDIFFVLSAFLITTLILEELDERQGEYSFRAFYWRRTFRLAPALLLWLVFIAAPTSVALHESSRISIGTAASLFYFGDFAIAAGVDIGDAYQHVWSLAIEEQFYAVWPFLLVYVVARSPLQTQRNWLTFGVVASVLIAIGARQVFAENYFLPTGHLTCLAAGCLAAHMFVRGGGDRLESFLSRQGVAPVCLAILTVPILLFSPRFGTGVLLIQVIVASATAALLLNLALRRESATARFLTTSPALWIGRRSYGLYLYHRSLTQLLPALFPGLTLRYAAPLALALSFVVAEVSFRFVERPVNLAGRAWLQRRHYPATLVPEFAMPIAPDTTGASDPNEPVRPRRSC